MKWCHQSGENEQVLLNTCVSKRKVASLRCVQLLDQIGLTFKKVEVEVEEVEEKEAAQLAT